MKIIIAGGTGFIGGAVLSRLMKDGHSITLLTRNAGTAGAWRQKGATVLSWADKNWPAALDDADAVINLAGEAIAGGRWTVGRKERILNSRLETTRALIDAMAKAKKRPGVLVNASAVGYYGPCDEEDVDETAHSGKSFLAEVCVAWEREALRARALGVRVVLLRIGVVLGRQGGALPRMLLPFRLGLGGRLGSGRQWFPWVHVDDVVGLAREALTNPALDGPVNATSPQPATNAEFTKALGATLRRPTIAPVPAFALRLLLGEMSEMLLTGQKVIPRAAERAGYRFRFPVLRESLVDLLKD
jgi:uncharacterized protein (TIGR01777 family)